MKVQVLYFDGCPTYGAAVKMLRKVLADEGVQAEVELVAVNTDKDACRLRFPGSPTIRVVAAYFLHIRVRKPEKATTSAGTRGEQGVAS
jgi:hypothetical protein